jgi:hypothetical protein
MSTWDSLDASKMESIIPTSIETRLYNEERTDLNGYWLSTNTTRAFPKISNHRPSSLPPSLASSRLGHLLTVHHVLCLVWPCVWCTCAASQEAWLAWQGCIWHLSLIFPNIGDIPPFSYSHRCIVDSPVRTCWLRALLATINSYSKFWNCHTLTLVRKFVYWIIVRIIVIQVLHQ